MLTFEQGGRIRKQLRSEYPSWGVDAIEKLVADAEAALCSVDRRIDTKPGYQGAVLEAARGMIESRESRREEEQALRIPKPSEVGSWSSESPPWWRIQTPKMYAGLSRFRESLRRDIGLGHDLTLSEAADWVSAHATEQEAIGSRLTLEYVAPFVASEHPVELLALYEKLGASRGPDAWPRSIEVFSGTGETLQPLYRVAQTMDGLRHYGDIPPSNAWQYLMCGIEAPLSPITVSWRESGGVETVLHITVRSPKITGKQVERAYSEYAKQLRPSSILTTYSDEVALRYERTAALVAEGKSVQEAARIVHPDNPESWRVQFTTMRTAIEGGVSRGQ